MLLISTKFSVPEANELAAILRPFTSVNVEEGPMPRSDAAALISAFTMVIAIFSVHAANGLFMTNNGYEFALTLLAATGALAIQGGGKFSIDSLISHKLNK